MRSSPNTAFAGLFALAFTLILVGCASFTSAPASVVVETSDNDPREYRHVVLDNGLEVMLVNDANTEVSAVSLSVGVGSYHNPPEFQGLAQDRKSTRLNSSHVAISYAVFCLKKKILGVLLSCIVVVCASLDS